MKQINNKNFPLLIMFVLNLALVGCVEYKEPPMIYEPNASYLPPAVIDSIEPADSAVAGVREIVIKGANFSTNPYFNQVYFDKYLGYIKSSTQNTIRVYRPPIYGDSITISIVVHGSLSIARFPSFYKIQNPIFPFNSGEIVNTRPSEMLMSMELDNSNNLYIAKSMYIYKITSPTQITLFKTCSPADLARIYDIRFGPGGYLYIAAAKTRIWRTRGESGNTLELYVNFGSSAGNLEKVEFDEYGNLFTGKTRGLFVATPLKTIINTSRYSANYTIGDIRVFNNEVYVYASYSGTDPSIPKRAIWKNTIYHTGNAVDSVGQPQLVLDITNVAGFQQAEISSFTFDCDGLIYMCMKNALPGQSFYVLESDGSITPFYMENILPSVLDQVVWGNGKELYLNRGRSVTGADSVQIYKVGTAKDGAPYFGRNL